MKPPTKEEIEELIGKYTESRDVEGGNMRLKVAYKDYYKIKMVAMTLEDKNYSELILFPSASVIREKMNIPDIQGKKEKVPGQIDDWYKMCKHSALIYKYVISTKIGRKSVNIINDTDMNHRLSGGIVAINGIDRFAASMEKAGFKKPTVDSLGIYHFSLNMRFKSLDIKAYEKQERDSVERINKMLLAKNPKPEVYGKWREIAKTIPPKIKSLKEPYRTMFANELLPEIMKLSANYRYYANGSLKAKEAQGRMINGCEILMSGINMMMEANLINKQEVVKCATLVTDMKLLIVSKIRDGA